MKRKRQLLAWIITFVMVLTIMPKLSLSVFGQDYNTTDAWEGRTLQFGDTIKDINFGQAITIQYGEFKVTNPSTGSGYFKSYYPQSVTDSTKTQGITVLNPEQFAAVSGKDVAGWKPGFKIASWKVWRLTVSGGDPTAIMLEPNWEPLAVGEPTVTAEPGDKKVTLKWNGVENATGYEVYSGADLDALGKRTTKETAAINTVAGNVYSCDITNLENGKTYWFFVEAVNSYNGGGRGSDYVSAMPFVKPAAPANLVVVGGNSSVTLSWNGAENATGYKVYKSTTSGIYTTEETAQVSTVADNVYSCKLTNLTNGVPYYFIVKAVNAWATSDASNEVNVTPKGVPGAPTGVTAVAGNGQATISFSAPADNGGSSINKYIVTSNPGGKTAEGAASPITVTGLTNGTVYTFTVKAANEVGPSVESAASNQVTPKDSSTPMPNPTSNPTPNPNPAPTPNPTPTSTPTPTPTPKEQPKNNDINHTVVNGAAQDVGTITTETKDGKTITSIVVDSDKLQKIINQLGENSVIQISTDKTSDGINVKIDAKTLESLISKNCTIEVKAGDAVYNLPVQKLKDALALELGTNLELKDIDLNIEISKPSEAQIKMIESYAAKNGVSLLVAPEEFEVTCIYKGKIIDIKKFNGYIARRIAIPAGVDANRVTTGIVIDADGSVRSIPTKVVQIEGKIYAELDSLTNSIYSVVEHKTEFKDMKAHWAKDAVNDMGARLIISGVGDNNFEPDRSITRAEFTAIAIRALGLPPEKAGTGASTFADVKDTDWYAGYIKAAVDYGMISGGGNGKFSPNDKITREQAMVIISKAMKITGLKSEFKAEEVQKLLSAFSDSDKAASWANESIAACTKLGIVSGKVNSKIAPKDNITRAEVAVIVQRLLKKANLIK